jgi:hypothetical protein
MARSGSPPQTKTTTLRKILLITRLDHPRATEVSVTGHLPEAVTPSADGVAGKPTAAIMAQSGFPFMDIGRGS